MNFNTCFKTIIGFTRHLSDASSFENYFFMVEFTAVRRSFLARLATATSGKPSTKFPLGELEGQEPVPLYFPIFSQKLKMFSFFNQLLPFEFPEQKLG